MIAHTKYACRLAWFTVQSCTVLVYQMEWLRQEWLRPSDALNR
jgi:hypothetical protein